MRFRRHFQEFFQKCLHTKVSHSRTEEHRSQFAIFNFFHVEFIACHIKQFNVITQIFVKFCAKQFLNLRVFQRTGSGFQFFGTVATVFFEQLNAVFQTVVNAFVVTIDTDRPVNGIRTNVQYFFQFIHQIKGVTAVTVQFVYKGKDRQFTTMANPEQFFSLRFYTFSCVNKHYCAVCCHKSTVSIFGEVLVTRGIENVYAITVVIKLQNRRSNGNTTLFFDFHPVRNSMFIAFSSFNGTSQMDSSTV